MSLIMWLTQFLLCTVSPLYVQVFYTNKTKSDVTKMQRICDLAEKSQMIFLFNPIFFLLSFNKTLQRSTYFFISSFYADMNFVVTFWGVKRLENHAKLNRNFFRPGQKKWAQHWLRLGRARESIDCVKCAKVIRKRAPKADGNVIFLLLMT